MKKYNLYKITLALALFCLAFASCEDDLDVDPRATQSELDILNDPENAIQLVNGVYNKNLEYGTNGFSWIGMTSITSDDADKGSTPGDTGAD